MQPSSAVVIGNGPSAKLLDFEQLRLGHIASVGMNAAYRYWDRIDFRPTYYICMDTVLIMSHADRIAELIAEGRIKKFLLRDEMKEKYPQLADHERVVWFSQLDTDASPVFNTRFITTGSWAIRWMASEGMHLIATIGIDSNYVEILTEARRVGEGSDLRLEITKTPQFNPNYFFSDYQQAGDRYNIPNDPSYKEKTGQLVHIEALRKAKEDIERLEMGVQVLDCSPLSNHGVFAKGSLDDFFRRMRFPLVTSFFLAATSETLESNLRSAIANCANPFVSSVQILFEGDVSLLETKVSSETMREVRRLESDQRLRFIGIDKRPHYKTLFEHARASGSHLYLVTNADIEIDYDTAASLVLDRFSDKSSTHALTRWNLTPNGRFLQAVAPTPPWSEIPYEKMTYKEVNYLSYDTYVCGELTPIPSSFSDVFIGTFGCDTALAALFRIAGTRIANPCLTYRTTHVDSVLRDYAEAADKHRMSNTLAVRKALAQRYRSNQILLESFDRLEELQAGSAYFGTPHKMGIWHSLYRMLGATPWIELSKGEPMRFVKIPIDATRLAYDEADICRQAIDAMTSQAFLEIEVSGGTPNKNYMWLLGWYPPLRELRERLYRYNWQSVLFLDHATESQRRVHADVLLALRDLLTASAHNLG